MEYQTQIDDILSELRFLEDQTAIQTEQYHEQMNRIGSRKNILLDKLEELNAIRPRQPTSVNSTPGTIRFNDYDFSVCWDVGRMQFRRDGVKAYQLLKISIEVGEEGIEIADLAEMIFGDPMANIKSPLRSAREACEKNKFPFFLDTENGKIIARRGA